MAFEPLTRYQMSHDPFLAEHNRIHFEIRQSLQTLQRQAQLLLKSPEDLVRLLESLRQSSSVQAYIDQFDEILTRVNLTEHFTMSCFLTGLRPHIADRVRQLFPTSLHQVFSDAKFVEHIINLEQLASKYSPPPLTSHTHEAESTLETDPEHDDGDAILDLAFAFNQAKVATIDIADDDDFKLEAKSEHFDGVEGDEIDSGVAALKSDVNKELIGETDSDGTSELDITFSLANSNDDVQDTVFVYEITSAINMDATPEAKLEQTLGVDNSANHEDDEAQSEVITTQIAEVDFHVHDITGDEEVLANDRAIRHVLPPYQLELDSSYSFDPFLISVSRRVQILVPQFGFPRISCPVVVNVLHLFYKFGEVHDSFKLFDVSPQRAYMSCILFAPENLSEFHALVKTLYAWLCWCDGGGWLPRVEMGLVLTRADVGRNASQGVMVQRRGGCIYGAGLCSVVASRGYVLCVEVRMLLAVLRNSFFSLYAKCRLLKHALNVFDGMFELRGEVEVNIRDGRDFEFRFGINGTHGSRVRRGTNSKRRGPWLFSDNEVTCEDEDVTGHKSFTGLIDNDEGSNDDNDEKTEDDEGGYVLLHSERVSVRLAMKYESDSTTNKAETNASSSKDGHHQLLMKMLSDELACKVDDIISVELNVCDTQLSGLGGANDEFIFSGEVGSLIEKGVERFSTNSENHVDPTCANNKERNSGRRMNLFLMLDDAGSVLDARFREELRVVFKYLPKKRQPLLLSTTVTRNLQTFLGLSANKAYSMKLMKASRLWSLLRNNIIVVPTCKDCHLLSCCCESLTWKL